MSNELHPPVELVNPADPLVTRVLRALSSVALVRNGRNFVVGATARDLMLTNIFGLPSGRATRDIDIAVAIENWEEFRALKEDLIASGEFLAEPRTQQRVISKAAGEGPQVPVDLIPFGGIASADGSIAWPPNGDVVMNVAGFMEVWTSAVRARVEEDLIVRIASIPGLTVLK